MSRRPTGRRVGRPHVLDDAAVVKARELHEGGASFRVIAKTLGCSRGTVAAELRAPEHQPEPADPPSDELGHGNGHASAVRSLAEIRADWLLDQRTDPDSDWYPNGEPVDVIRYAMQESTYREGWLW